MAGIVPQCAWQRSESPYAVSIRSMPNHSVLEAVHVENAWWDAPRAGIADIAGQPHRFVASSDIDAPEVIFHIWPISPEELLLEQEQWQIFVR
ncbi:MAG: hypothetical protein LBJ15_01145 [Comamonas sp.]|uniref:hypothetical protein n=1 Tax=Comamonas sp. TaxID=34028 RepID=UPI00282D98D2|nr:hypothetical protein [Comamonas sp.]MDR0212592.1 hypothetical protein [Comamonas sp.]